MDATERKPAMAGVFGRAAATYDAVGLDYFGVFGAELVRRAGVRPGEVVLDLGAGRGAVTLPAARAVGPDGRVVAGDLAPEMVELLAADTADLGNVEVSVMDAEDPGLPPASVDVVLASMVVFMLPDPVAALRRYRELVRAGGRVGVTTFTGPDAAWEPLGRILDAASPPFLRGDPDAGPGPVGTPERLAETLRGCGFRDVTVEVVSHEFVFDSADQWWAWSWSHGRRVLFEVLGPEGLERLKAEVDPALAEIAGPDGRLPLRQGVCYAVGTA